MKQHFFLVAGFLLLPAGMTCAQESRYLGAQFYNGTPDTIVDARAARADNCERFICGEWNTQANPTEAYLAHADHCETNACGEWQARGEAILPLKAHAVATVLPLSPDSDEADCLWDVRIVTGQAGSNAGSEYIFKGLNFCTPSMSAVSFEQTELGATAVQSFKNQQGNVSSIVSPALKP